MGDVEGWTGGSGYDKKYGGVMRRGDEGGERGEGGGGLNSLLQPNENQSKTFNTNHTHLFHTY